MKTISHHNLLLIGSGFKTSDFIDRTIHEPGLDRLPVRIFGIDTITEHGELRADTDAAPPDDPHALPVLRYDSLSRGWSDSPAGLNIENVFMVVIPGEPGEVIREGTPAKKTASGIVEHIIRTIVELPSFVIVSENPDDADESAYAMTKTFRRSRAELKFYSTQEYRSCITGDIYETLRSEGRLSEYTGFSSGERIGHEDPDQVWMQISRKPVSPLWSFHDFFLDVVGTGPRPAGILIRRNEKENFELYTTSSRPATGKTSPVTLDDLKNASAFSRTWITPEKGLASFSINEPGETLTPGFVDMLGSLGARDATEQLSIFSDIAAGMFPVAPEGSGIDIGISNIKHMMIHTRLPLGEIGSAVKAEISRKSREAGCADTELSNAGPELIKAAESKLRTMIYDHRQREAVFFVSGCETTENSVRKTVAVKTRALIPSPVAEKPTLCYLANILDTLRLLEEARPGGELRIEIASVFGLKVAPDHELYEIGIDFNLPAGTRSETDDRIQNALFLLHEFMDTLAATDLRRDISLFDLIGPSMIGPSSSHTCGANRIGRLAARLINKLLPPGFDPAAQALCLSARLHNSFRKSGEGHHTLNALAAGLLHDLPQDHTGTDADAVRPWEPNPPEGRPDNIAFFDYSPWIDGGESKTCAFETGRGPALIHWAGYHKFDPSRSGADIPLPPGHPRDIHENSVAILLRLVPLDSLNPDTVSETMLLRPGDREFEWSDFDLVIIGESVGGGKIRIRSVGGKAAAVSLDYFAGRGWNVSGGAFATYPREGGPAPLDGNHANEYDGIDNLNPNYPPKEMGLDNTRALPYYDLDSLMEYARESGKDLSEIAIEYECRQLGLAPDAGLRETIMAEVGAMRASLDASARPFSRFGYSVTTPETGNVIKTYMKLREARGNVAAEFLGNSFYDAASGSITAMTRNAFSELILAAPTGGACGVLAGTYLALNRILIGEGKMTAEEFESAADRALLVAGLLSAVLSNIVPPSGAEKGCQAETGTAAGMGAAFAAYILGGNSEQVVNAMILAMKNSLGLVCDPIAGKVNTPCIKRNAFKSIEALLGAWLSLNGIVSFVSPGQVVKAMSQIGDDMSSRYRETSEGGLAKTIAGLKERICRFS
ncbi:MAG TPA: L-serine ammonia-lyase, iron-sulfur-dependent, subunit alpha [bacterium]|nr:L-serine ammonia-lyase, iron-sulfur-dependent, subunit alpha [bacterium]